MLPKTPYAGWYPELLTGAVNISDRLKTTLALFFNNLFLVLCLEWISALITLSVYFKIVNGLFEKITFAFGAIVL